MWCPSQANCGAATSSSPAVNLNVAKASDGVAARFQRSSGGGLVDIETYNGIGGIGTSDNIPFRLNTNNTERMRIDSSGNVGIGTSSPNLGGVNKAITLNSAASTNASYELSINGTFIGSMYTNTADSSMRFGTWQNAPMVFLTNSTERARITSGGDFMVGTTTTGGKITALQTSNGSYVGSLTQIAGIVWLIITR